MMLGSSRDKGKLDNKKNQTGKNQKKRGIVKVDKDTDELDRGLKSVKNVNELNKWMDDNEIGTTAFGDYLIGLRQRKGWSQELLADRAVIGKGYVSELEQNKKRNPERKKVLRLALALELNLEETNRLLKLSGNSCLYSRRREDSYIIFGIKKGYTLEKIFYMLEQEGMEDKLNG